MIISKLTLDDYDDVYDMWLSCKGMGLNSLDDSIEGIEKFINRNPDTCFVAKINDRVVGSILVGNDGRRGYIYHTAVSPNYRNQGIGKKLVNKAIRELEIMGISKVVLVVFEKNEVGNAFWESMGFTARNDLVYRNKSIKNLIHRGYLIC